MMREQVRYSESFKIHLVKQIESGEIGVEAARRKYEIGGKMTISRWRRKYANCRITESEIEESMKRKIIENPLERKLRETESELYLYKKLIETSDYFRQPSVKKKIVERLSAYLGKTPEELTRSDIPFLKSVLYSESQGKDITNMKPDPGSEQNERR